jgi:hypothetical protein
VLQVLQQQHGTARNSTAQDSTAQQQWMGQHNPAKHTSTMPANAGLDAYSAASILQMALGTMQQQHAIQQHATLRPPPLLTWR